MKNKKGITLVELLAVVVILALLAIVVGTAITKMVKDSKEKLRVINSRLWISNYELNAFQQMIS